MIDWKLLRSWAGGIARHLGLAAGPPRLSYRPAPAARRDDPPPPPPADPPPDPARVQQAERNRARAALIDALSPSIPVDNRSQLLGRETEMRRIFTAIADLQGHALIHGARGAGKTSLARGFGDYADERGMAVIYGSCDGGVARFADIFRPYLEWIPDTCFARADLTEARAALRALPGDFGPRELAAVLARVTAQRAVFIVDEFDRVSDPGVRNDVATFVKLLSDLRSGAHLLFVGIARDALELVEGHASLRRHLVATGLRRFDAGSANMLLDEGERRSGIRFDAEARTLLLELAGGSPYHLRLFAFTAGMEAIDRDERRITSALLVRGLRSAYENWSALSPAAAALFERAAAQGPAHRRWLEALALTALNSDILTMDALAARIGAAGHHESATGAAAAAIDSVRPALVAPGGDGGALMFDDTLAPQFLLLACCFAEQGGSAAGRHAA